MRSRSTWLDEDGTFQQLAIGELIANPVQPPARTADAATKEIGYAIGESRLITPLVVVKTTKGKYMVVDGHRRLSAAIQHGRQTVPCFIANIKDPELTFVLLGRGVRGVGSVDWFSVWARSDSDRRDALLESLPKAGASKIEDMVEIFGLTRALELAADGVVSPHISRWINLTTKLVRQFCEPLDNRVVGEWMLKHKQSDVINQAERQNAMTRVRSKRLRDCIVQDKPFVLFPSKRKTRAALRRVS